MIEDFKDKVICGDVWAVLKDLPDESVDCILTSPPYFGLRDYSIEPQIWDGDILLTCATCNGIFRIDRNTYTIKGVEQNGSSKNTLTDNLAMQNMRQDGESLLQTKKTQQKTEIQRQIKNTARQGMLQKPQCQDSLYGGENQTSEFKIQHRKLQYKLEGGNQKNTRIQNDIGEKSSEQCKGIYNGTSISNGEDDRQIFKENRVCSSYKRNKKRQSSRKSSISTEQNSQRSSDLSFLQQTICDKLRCPTCGDRLQVKKCEHRWVEHKQPAKGGRTRPENPPNVGANRSEQDNGISIRFGHTSNFCSLCSAWKGSLGLEPTPELYISHLCGIFDEIKRVLKKTGSCWVNIGDGYSANRSYQVDGTKQVRGSQPRFQPNLSESTQPKSLIGIPEMFVLEMQKRGWIRRNTLIWFKPNPMPSSAGDRFTVDFEYLYFFTKNSKTQYWTNEKTLELTSKAPLGTKGIGGQDWEWRECPNCKGTGKIEEVRETKIEESMAESMGSPRARYHRNKIGECKRCKGTGQIKHNFWSGHDVWFEQQFEAHNHPEFISQNYGQYSEHNKFSSKEGNRSIKCGTVWSPQKRTYNPQGRNKRCVSIMSKEDYLDWQAEVYDVAKTLMDNKAGSVWKISTQAFKEAHFATFPEKLCETPIKAGCPEFICKKCGKAREKIFKAGFTSHTGKTRTNYDIQKSTAGRLALLRQASREHGEEYLNSKEFTGYTDCGCDHKDGWDSGICLDPFGGSGTVGVVAKKLGRHFIIIDIKPEYCEMAKNRIVKVQKSNQIDMMETLTLEERRLAQECLKI